MGGTTKPSDAVKDADQPAEKKKAFIDWMNLMKLGHEEKDHWVRTDYYTILLVKFSYFVCEEFVITEFLFLCV